MYDKWNLDILYKGYDDPAFLNDWKKLEQILEELKQFAKDCQKMEDLKMLKEAVAVLENHHLVGERLGSFVSLRQATDTTDAQTVSLIARFSKLVSQSGEAEAMINKRIAAVSDLDALIKQDEVLQEYAYLFHNIKEENRYLLDDAVEGVIAKLNLSGPKGWEDLQQYLTSTLIVDYKGSNETLSSIRNMAYSADKEVRKSAYEAELKAYDKIKEAIAFSLNNLKSYVNTIVELRGYDSALDMTLKQAHMKQETLDAMFGAMKRFMPKFHAYYRRKAELLGYQNGLPWYELFAPMGESSQVFTPESAHRYLLDHFKDFDMELHDMIDRAFKEEWIDFFPRSGKVGGAFCANLTAQKVSRVLTNFDGGLGDVVTLAHELGHAFHGQQIESHRPLNTDYSMPVAETASTFNENIIMNAAIAETSDPQEKAALIENQLQDLSQIICDIYSRFLFEDTVFNRCKNEFLFAKDLEEIMLEAQKEAYGNGLDHDVLHPYMWICKSHYYSAHLSYYNFPYAFGGLFARGLIVKYQQEGKAFVEKYKQLLHATTVADVEEVAKMADIDLTDQAFWESSLQTASDLIDQYLELTK